MTTIDQPMTRPVPVPSPASALSPIRRWLALLALALGGFGIGVTEFVTMGLLPNMARDLLPALAATNGESANAQSGILISAYALGVVVGAPTIAAAAARWPRRRLLVALVAGLAVGNLLSALLPSFGLMVIARFLSGLPHGAYFGIASLAAATLLGPGKRARGVAFVLSGLTIANVVGVPLGTFLGQNLGWRAAFWLVTVTFVLTLVAIVTTLPYLPGDRNSSIRGELSAFGRLQVWLALGIASIGFGGLFAVYSYISPVVTDVTGLDESAVPWILVVFGIGMTAGNLFGGWYADRSVPRALSLFMMVLTLSIAGFGLTAHTVVGLCVFVFLIGAAASAASPAIQTRLMDVARDSQAIAAALNHSALNIGNSLGAFLGGLVIAAHLGYTAPAAVGVALGFIGIVIVAVSLSIDRRRAGDAASRS